MFFSRWTCDINPTGFRKLSIWRFGFLCRQDIRLERSITRHLKVGGGSSVPTAVDEARGGCVLFLSHCLRKQHECVRECVHQQQQQIEEEEEGEEEVHLCILIPALRSARSAWLGK